jgi:dihydrofolate reductase
VTVVVDLVLIAAIDRQRAIGRGNALPWHLPDDLKRFKEMTLGKHVLMGRKTAEAIGRPLPGRPNVVLTRSGRAPYEGQVAVATLDEAIARADAPELVVIGGGELYALALPHAARLHLTEVDTVVDDADAWFPPLDTMQWRELAREHHAADARHAVAFDFVDLVRR